MIPLLLIHLIKIACVIGVMLGIVAYTVLAERKICAWMQDRIGPNRVGPFGLLQPLADGLKFVFKEDVLPHHVNKVYFTLAPMIAMIPALITIAVVPWGSQLVIPSISPRADPVRDCQPECRHPVRVRDCLAGRVRHRAGGVVEQLEVSVPRRHPLQRADDFLRSLPRIERGAGVHAGRLAQSPEGGRIPGAAHVAGVHPAAVVFHFPRERVRRDQPPAVRFARGGTGAGRWVPHRVQLDEVRDVLHG